MGGCLCACVGGCARIHLCDVCLMPCHYTVVAPIQVYDLVFPRASYSVYFTVGGVTCDK